MIKKILTLVFVFNSIISFSQDIVNSIPLLLKGDQDVFQIVGKNKKDVTLFLSDKKKVSALQLNQQMQIIDSLSSNRPENDFTEMIGYINSGNQYKVLWSTPNSKEIFSQNYDFEKRMVTTKNFNFELKNEKIIQRFSDNDHFYIATVLRNSNTLKFYVFDNTDIVSEKTINLDEGFHFYLSTFKKSNLYGVLSENLLPFESAFSLQQITTDSPTSLTYSSKKRKCYIKEGQFIISFDTNSTYTQLININLSDFTASEKILKNAFIATGADESVQSNSFLVEEKLFQLKLSSQRMVLTVKDLNDNLLKEYTANTEGEINFKNSPMIQENGSSDNQKNLEKTSQFLRKVNNSNCGVSCYKTNGNYFLKIGSVSEIQQSNGVMYGAMFGVAGVLIAAAISNPTLDNFNSYANRRVVYINSLFDSNNNHIAGEIGSLAFDKIQNYIEQNKKLVSSTIFKMNNTYYFGNYNEKAKQYELRTFID